MPTNVPPPYREAEARFRAAKTAEEKIAALEEMLRLMPKHKGTDKLQADVKTRIAKLRRQPGGKKGGPRTATHMVAREGAGQVALVGSPNTGKSALLAALTRAEPRVADFPYATVDPLPGMMTFEDVSIQLIDLPPISEEHVEHWVFDMIRRADLLWLVVDSAGALDEVETCRRLLAEKKIGIHPPGDGGGDDGDSLTKPALLVVTGRDRPGSDENLQILRELLEVDLPVLSVSATTGEALEQLRAATFEALHVIRVYTKQPGKPPDRERPFTLPHGATLQDLARLIHKDLSQDLKFARIWGSNVFDGQPVQRDHVLDDGDVVEIHTH